MHWSRIVTKNIMKLPSCRCDHRGWEYGEKLWIFGGRSEESPSGYHDFEEFDANGYTNQLLCFNPSDTEWTYPKCAGSVPTPRAEHATTRVNDKVWLYGGTSSMIRDSQGDDLLYELDMRSLVWTQIQTAQPIPQSQKRGTLSVFKENKLLFHDGTDMWILDLQSKSWKHHQSTKPRLPLRRSLHTSVTSLHGHVTIIGGTDQDTAFLVMFEPRSLQQLAMQTIDKHRTLLHSKCLPNKLIDQLE